ncbi:hypothetical protein L7F22_061560 [Adiantum nelumboides]|nr:hypothetical protein [Adiantum nelumboides]
MDECFAILDAHGKFEVDTTTSHDNDLLLPMGNTLADTVAIAQAKVAAIEQAKVSEEEFAAVQATCLAKRARVDSPPPATTPLLLDPKGKSSVDLYLHPMLMRRIVNKRFSLLLFDSISENLDRFRFIFLWKIRVLTHWLSNVGQCDGTPDGSSAISDTPDELRQEVKEKWLKLSKLLPSHVWASSASTPLLSPVLLANAQDPLPAEEIQKRVEAIVFRYRKKPKPKDEIDWHFREVGNYHVKDEEIQKLYKEYLRLYHPEMAGDEVPASEKAQDSSEARKASDHGRA